MKTSSGLVPDSEGTLLTLRQLQITACQPAASHTNTPKHSQNSLSQSMPKLSCTKKLYLNSISSLYILNLWTSSWYIHISTLGHRLLHKPHMKSRPLQSHLSSLSPLTKGSFQTRYCDDQRRGGSKVAQIVGTWKWLQLRLLDWKTSGELLTTCYNKLCY